jgi:HTH-type transcriptional regulator, sugar sensing transcriptional regulator
MPSEPLEADLIDRLVRYGLGQGEARCYVAMLAPRAFKVSEIARSAGVPRSRAYELINSLVRSGLCSEVAGGRVARFRAAPPNEAIGRLEAILEEQERRRTAAMATIMRAIESRESDPEGEGGDEPVRTLRRSDQVYGAYHRLLGATREEVVAVVAMPWAPVLRLSPNERLAAGVRMRAVHEQAVCSSEPQRDFVSFYSAQGVDTRVVAKVQAQFALFDRRRCILHLTKPKAGSRQLESLLINHAGLGQTLQRAFESLWDRGTPLDQAMGKVPEQAAAGSRRDPREPRELVPRGQDGRFVGYD